MRFIFSLFLAVAMIAPSLSLGQVAINNDSVFSKGKVEKNYISNGHIESNITGWAKYADAAGVAPVDCTGGSAASTLARTTTTPLANTGSLLWTKSATDKQGDGWAYAFTIDKSKRGTQFAINYDYEIASGTFASGDVSVWIYDVTNSRVIQPSAYLMGATTIPGPAQTLTFQTSVDSSSYRLCFHTASTSSLAYSIKVDEVKVGPLLSASGFAGSDTVSWTPTLNTGPSTNRTLSGVYGRSGEYLEGRFRISYTGAPSFSGTGISFNLPNGLVIDTAKLTGTNIYSGLTGQGAHTDVGVQINQVSLAYESTTALRLTTYLNGGSGTVTQAQDISATAPFTIGNGDYTEISFRVPIVGWSTGVLSSDSAATRSVTFKGTDGTGTLNGSANTISYTNAKDTHGMYSAGSITIKVPGDYQVSAGTAMSGTYAVNQGCVLSVFKNGVVTKLTTFSVTPAAGSYTSATVSGIMENLVAGDILTIRVSTDGTTPSYLTSYNTVSVSMIQGPEQIQAATAVVAKYNSAAGQSMPSAATTIIDFDTKVYDSLGSVTTGASWKFTAPSSGWYSFKGYIQTSAQSYTAGSSVNIDLWKNGVDQSNRVSGSIAQTAVTMSHRLPFSDDVYLLTGEYFDLRLNHNEAAARTLESGTYFVHIAISKVGGVN